MNSWQNQIQIMDQWHICDFDAHIVVHPRHPFINWTLRPTFCYLSLMKTNWILTFLWFPQIVKVKLLSVKGQAVGSAILASGGARTVFGCQIHACLYICTHVIRVSNLQDCHLGYSWACVPGRHIHRHVHKPGFCKRCQAFDSKVIQLA